MKTLPILLLAGLLGACRANKPQRQHTCSFTYTPEHPVSGGTIEVVGSAAGATSWSWTVVPVGGKSWSATGQTTTIPSSMLESPTGDYPFDLQVTLEVTWPAGATATSSQTVHISK